MKNGFGVRGEVNKWRMGWGEADAHGPSPVWSGIAVAPGGPGRLTLALLLCTLRSKPCPFLAPPGQLFCSGLAVSPGSP